MQVPLYATNLYQLSKALPNHERSLGSEVLAFFSPVNSQMDPLFVQSSTPRANIVENVKTKTKMVTVRRDTPHEDVEEANHSAEIIDSNGENGCYRLGRLDSSTNPDLTAKLDEMAHQLGFRLPSERNPDTSLQTMVCSDWEVLQKTNSTDAKPPIITDHVEKPILPPIVPKRSILSTIMKRFSVPRKREEHVHIDNVRPDCPKIETDHSSPPKNNRRPRSIRRWFTRRLWRSKPPLSKTFGENSEHSLASADATLDGGYISSTDELSNAALCMRERTGDSSCLSEMPFRRSQVRNSLIDPDQARQCTSLEELSEHSSFPILDRCTQPHQANGHPLSPTAIRDENNFHENGMHPITSAVDSPASPLRSSFHNSLAREHSVPAVSNRTKGRVHFQAHPLGTGELYRTTPGASVSEAQLAGTLNAADTHSPSYLSVSISAFGYSGYNNTSLSSHNLVSKTVTPRPTALSLSPPATTGRTSPRHNRAIKPLTPLGPRDHRMQPLFNTTKPNDVSSSSLSPDVCISPCMNAVESFSVNSLEGTVTRRSDAMLDVEDKPPSPCPSTSDTTTGSGRFRRVRTRSNTGTPDDQEHWQRSSLIILAVSHASPRVKPCAAASDIPPTPPLLVETNGIESHSPALADSDPKTPIRHIGIEQGCLQSSEPSLVSIKITDTFDPAVRDTLVIDGHYFLRQVDQTQAELFGLINQTEHDLQSTSLEEETAGLLRSATGKARLLISEKFAQFRNLCQQNLDWECNPLREEMGNTASGPLVTLISDLDGFWAMVTLQVCDLRRIFEQIEQLRQNDWKSVDESRNGSSLGEKAGSTVVDHSIHKTPISKRKSTQVHTTTGKTQDTVARMKARERLQAIKREMRAKRSMQPANSDTDELFIAV